MLPHAEQQLQSSLHLPPLLLPAGRDNFLTEVWKWVDQYGGRICDQLRRIGSSVDWSRKAFTMDENLSVSERGGCSRDNLRKSEAGLKRGENEITCQ